MKPKLLLCLAFVLSGGYCTVSAQTNNAKRLDVSQYFNYPNTTLVVTTKEEPYSLQIMPIAGNFEKPKKTNSAPRFNSGMAMPIANHITLRYEMLTKTNNGDLYRFVIHRSGQTNVVEKALFTGSPQTIMDDPDFRIVLLPERPDKKSQKRLLNFPH